jgi:hypothetical protein
MAQGPWRSPIRPPRQFAATQQFSRFGAKRTFSEPRLNRIYEYAPYYERAPAPTTRRTSTRSARRQGWATQAPLRHLTREFIRAAGAAGRRVRDLRQAAGETAAGKPAFTLPAISVPPRQALPPRPRPAAARKQRSRTQGRPPPAPGGRSRNPARRAAGSRAGVSGPSRA